ncbi:phage holin [Adlercreutzia muris]|uniref:Phage holin n=1 Tax=Adlercreutzia muris TaxID=1796610 RepID=A0A7C8BRC1_9ACTN|nr:phage holin [Adlercreutzia muris]KAB1650686.1 phage holin [Adlercreutzia muris]MCR2027702.1 phage holin [Adlercreutzia muris]
MINWKVRVKQKWFWLTIIPAVLMLLDQLWGLFALLGSIEAGHLYDGPLMEALLSLVGTVFAVLVLVGLPVDTTTDGYGDSARALAYREPAPNASAYGLKEYEEQCAAADAKMVDLSDLVHRGPVACTISAAELADAVSTPVRPADGEGADDGDR